MTDEDSEQQWEQRLAGMFAEAEGWAHRMVAPPPIAAPGSSLAADDALFPQLPPSHLAYALIVSGTEHFEMVRADFLANHTLYPSAQFTVLRSALMGAAQALWVLSGDRRKRQERGLRLVREDLRQRLVQLNEDFIRTGLPAHLVEAERQSLARQLSEVVAAAGTLGFAETEVRKKWKLLMTSVIGDVSELLPEPQDQTFAAGIRLLWRTQSAHAHITPLAKLHQLGPDLTRVNDTTQLGPATSSMAELGAAAAASFLLLQRAWWLYDQRCQPPAG